MATLEKAIKCSAADIYAFELRFHKPDAEQADAIASLPMTLGGKRSSSSRNIFSGSGVVWCFGTASEQERDRWINGLQARIDERSLRDIPVEWRGLLPPKTS